MGFGVDPGSWTSRSRAAWPSSSWCRIGGEPCAVQPDAFVIRDAEAGVPELVAANVAPHVSVLSAGEAHVAHPTQGLLDALTVWQRRQRFAGLAVAVVGDIRHSRVARSAWHAFSTLGVRDLRIAAPPALMPDPGEFSGCTRHTELASALEGADVVMMLRSF